MKNAKLMKESPSDELLKALHLMTRDGRHNADALRKIKQVRHFLHFLEKPLQDCLDRYGKVSVVDVGAGKSYLGFWLNSMMSDWSGEIVSIESRPELIQKSEELARQMGFTNMKFIEGKIESATLADKPHLVMALHACDTATDDAIHLALKNQAQYVVLVPCCQAEVAKILENVQQKDWDYLWERPLHRREFGSHLTNTLRALFLESHGYQVTVTELTGWEHSMKNELILAKKVHREHAPTREKLSEIRDRMQLGSMKLFQSFEKLSQDS